MNEPQQRGFWEAPVPPAWAVRALAKGIIGPERFEALVAYTADPTAVRRRIRPRAACSCRNRARRGCTSWQFHRLS
jgi:hypothetical protein